REREAIECRDLHGGRGTRAPLEAADGARRRDRRTHDRDRVVEGPHAGVPEDPRGLPQPLHPDVRSLRRGRRRVPSSRRPRAPRRGGGQGAAGLHRQGAGAVTIRRGLSYVLAAALVLGARDASAGPRITSATVTAVERWLNAINHHAPRTRDEALAYAWDLTLDARADLNDGIGFFFAALMGDELKIRSAFEERLAALGRGQGNPQRFLRRAALFHTDAAVERPPNRWAPPPAAASKRRDQPVPPLFRSGRAIIDNAGEDNGRSEKDWNWSFARYLIELSAASPADDSFAVDWYHATAGMMLFAGNYAEAAAHLKRAAELLPNDPFILFDRACLSEVYGLPITQQMLSDADVGALRQGAADARRAVGRA